MCPSAFVDPAPKICPRMNKYFVFANKCFDICHFIVAFPMKLRYNKAIVDVVSIGGARYGY